MNRSTGAILLVLGLTFLPAVMALEFDLNESFTIIGRVIYDLLTKEYIVFGITIIVLIILFRNIFLAGLNRVPHLAQSGISKSIALAFSLLSTLGIAYTKFQSGANVHGFLEDILGPAGLWAAIFLVIMMYLWFKGTIGKWALTATGLSCYAVGSMVNQPLMMSIGLLITLFSVFKLFRGTGNQKYSNYDGSSTSGEGLRRTLLSKTPDEKRKQRDAIELIKRQISDSEIELKIMRDLDAMDAKLTQLRKIEDKLESDSGIGELIKEEKELLEQEEGITRYMNRLRQNLRDYEQHSSPQDPQFIQKRNVLRNKFVDYQILHRRLSERFKILIVREQQAVKQADTLEKAEKTIEEKKINEERKAVRTAEEQLKMQKELVKEASGEMQQREITEEHALYQLDKIWEEIEKFEEMRQNLTQSNITLIEKLKKANEDILKSGDMRDYKIRLMNQKRFWYDELKENSRRKGEIGYRILQLKNEEKKALENVRSAEQQDLKTEKKLVN